MELLKMMKLIRQTELEIAKRYNESKMRCPTHLSVGQEAVSAAVSEWTEDHDYAVSTHRAHAHYLGKGGNLNLMIAELYGKQTGCAAGRGGSMHLIDLNVNFMGTSAIVGNSIPVGVGLGLSAKLNKKNQVSLVFLGDAATEEGAFYESVSFACVKNIPVVFICENNLYSVYTGLEERQPKSRKIYELAAGIGIKHSKVEDGNDAIKASTALRNAIKYTRKTSMPSFLEFKTYRWLEHCGPNNDDELNYRPLDEISEWRSKDPINRLEKQLLKRGVSREYISKLRRNKKKN